MDKTYTFTYFGIESIGEVMNGVGLVGCDRSIFNPDDITKVLGIQPFKCWTKGDKRKNGSQYLFSSWDAEKSVIEGCDVEAQCMETILNLKSKIPILNQIKEQYDVAYGIIIVAYIYGDEQPSINFNKDIIEFCYLSGTTIHVDMYVSPDGNIAQTC